MPARTLIAGATGMLGTALVTAAHRQGHEVHALVRPGTRGDRARMRTLASVGAVIHEGDLADPAGLLAACRQVDNVVSAVTWMSGDERRLVEAAGQAGVQRFVPAAFGIDFGAVPRGTAELYDLWAEVHQAVLAAGVPYTYVHANGFFSYFISTLGDMTRLGGPRPPSRVSLYGTGDTPAAFADEADVAAVTIRALDDPRMHNRRLRFTRNVTTQRALIERWRNRSGRHVDTEPVAADELDAMIDGLSSEDQKGLRIALQIKRAFWIQGHAMSEHPDTVEAGTAYPDLRFTTIDDHLAALGEAAAEDSASKSRLGGRRRGPRSW